MFGITHTKKQALAFGLALLSAVAVKADGQSSMVPAVQLVSSSMATVSELPEAPSAAGSVASPGQAGNTGTTLALASRSTFPSARQRGRSFVFDLVGPTAFIAPLFESGIDTVRPLKVGYPSDGYLASGNHPDHGSVPEWGEGAQGYAKRYADRFGQGLVSTTTRYVLGEALRQDVTYHRCECTGFLPRTGHALLGAYVAHTRGGRAVPSLPALAAPYIGSEVAVAAWYPSRYNASDALRISLLNYVAAPFKNLFSEFIAR